MAKTSRQSCLWAGVLAIALASMPAAWACVPEPFLAVDGPSSVPVGGEVTVKGADFSGDVELRWNGLDGPLVASTKGPVFSARVKVPDTSDGVYLIVALSRSPDGSVASRGSTPVDVRSGGLTPATTRPPAVASDQHSSSPNVAGLALGGLVLASAGGFVGAQLARRRSGQSRQSERDAAVGDGSATQFER